MSMSKDYELIETGDGSPSLKWRETESMHHSGGAYAETQFIYGELIRHCLGTFTAKTSSLSFLSLGLGMGYNELLIVCEALKSDFTKPLLILSYESDPRLKNNFLHWLSEKPTEFSKAYDKMFLHFLQDYPEVAPRAKKHLWGLYENKEWKIEGALKKESIQKFPAQVILYDAFSAKTSPELWSEDFLAEFLKLSAAEECGLATYACTGILKRSLEKAGFRFEQKAGFAGKRNSSRALKK